MPHLLWGAAVTAASDSVPQCIANTRWHHKYELHVEIADPKEVLPICRSAFVDEPNNNEVKFGIARLHYESGEFQKAIDLLNDLLVDKYADAGELLGNIYFFGDGVEVSYEKFFEYAKKAYDLGSVSAANQLHHIYYWGYSVKSNDQIARKYLEEAVERGDSRSIIELGKSLVHGFGGYEVDLQRAKSVILEELKSGNPDAEILLNEIRLYEPRDLAELYEVRRNLIRLSEEGFETAIYNVLQMEASQVWFEDVGKKYGYKQDSATAAKYSLRLLDTSFGLSRFVDLVYYNQLGATFSAEQSDPIIERLNKIANDASVLDVRSTINANTVLSDIYAKGIFGPIDEGLAINYLKVAAEKYGDGTSATDASWMIFSSRDYFDLKEAIRLAKLSLLSDEPSVQAAGHTNLGVYYHYSDLPDGFELAKHHYEEAANLYMSQDYFDSYPFDNLARINLFNISAETAKDEEARKWAKLSDENDGNHFFSTIIDKYPFTNSTDAAMVRSWLEAEALDRNPTAFLELAFFEENFENEEKIIQWYKLCSMMCEDLDRERANQELSKRRRNSRGVVYENGEELATLWLKETLEKTALVNPSEKLSTSSIKSDLVLNSGRLYSLLIGVKRYEHFENLSTPIRDIYRIGGILETKYGSDVIYLENPSRSDITTELNSLRKKLKSDDSLLIYFAGHGILDETTGEGYWLPKEAEIDDDTNWVSNNYVLNKLKSFSATNVMLVADSCFSGSIITRGISVPTTQPPQSALEKYLKTPSRIALTSGGLKPVLDGGAAGNSIFAASFATALESFSKPVTSTELYLSVRDAVTKRSLAIGVDQTPLRGEITASGHQGPDFVLVPK